MDQSYTLPSLPSNSYLAAISLHLHRLADTLGLDSDSKSVVGVKKVVEEGLKSVAGWQGWVGNELGSWIGWNSVDVCLDPLSHIEIERTDSGGRERLYSKGIVLKLNLVVHQTRECWENSISLML